MASSERQRESRPAGVARAAHLLGGGTAVIWVVAIATTFVEGTRLWVLPLLGALLLGAVCVLFLLFLARRGRPWRSAAVVFVAWGLGALLVSNGVADLLLRWERTWDGFDRDGATGWSPVPNLDAVLLPAMHGRTYVVSTDDEGFREPVVVTGREVPVLLQGDSNTFGYGLSDDETLSARVNHHAGKPIALNAGVPGYDPHHFWFQYEQLAADRDVGTRVILFNVDNDFSLAAVGSPYLLRRPYLRTDRDEVVPIRSHVGRYHLQAYGWHFVEPYAEFDESINDPAYDWAARYPDVLLRPAVGRQLVRVLHPAATRVGELLRPPPKKVGLQGASWLWLGRKDWPAPFPEFADRFPTLLAALRDQYHDTVVFAFPSRTQIVPAERRDRINALLANGADESEIEPQRLQGYLAEWCREAGVDFVDLAPRFEAVADPVSLYQPDDGHLSAKGIDLCAEAITEYVDRRR